jgi:hypothetical protein
MPEILVGPGRRRGGGVMLGGVVVVVVVGVGVVVVVGAVTGGGGSITVTLACALGASSALLEVTGPVTSVCVPAPVP